MSPTEKHIDEKSLENYRDTPIWCILDFDGPWSKNAEPYPVMFVEFNIITKNGVDFKEVTVNHISLKYKITVSPCDLFFNYQDALNAYFYKEIDKLKDQISDLKESSRCSCRCPSDLRG